MGEHRWELTGRIAAGRVVGIVRAPSGAEAVRAGSRLLAAGLAAVEVSLSTPGALAAITDLAARARTRSGPAPGTGSGTESGTESGTGGGGLVGAGTVLDAHQAVLAIGAGARFLVCPSLDREVVRAAHRHGVPVVAGAATPTEIVTALEEGADLIKLFPASQTSPASLRDLLQALPHAPIVPTGGVTVRTAPEWIAAGAVAVGMGGELTRGAPEDATPRVHALLAALAEAAGPRG
ncbi:bifunctional 4-hydroxy-2-oxoglutarate aldolase/2-dehydro-3-deoxy-phosphogluconate aldolase [Nonomuraea indica]|uniref:bifunctional 4-hydroxy-2-oxoglutarate aldolase/2-dehydro-3-deoxy-phosphogluconate aldolase n=1 Tax=Nonomuraea indica TaxID=1581193 RepID=UPI000C7D5931|nr:2-dehydro-3-deoxyphosphogluconate aldolase [Nonomuraea indica]